MPTEKNHQDSEWGADTVDGASKRWTIVTDDMRLESYGQVEAFLAAAGGRLRAREAQESLSLGVVLRLRGGQPYGEGRVFLGCVTESGRVVATGIRTPPYGLILSTDEGAEAAADLFAERLAETAADLPSVHGHDAAARRFAKRWRALTGKETREEAGNRLYRLTRVAPPRDVPGRFRAAVGGDVERLATWAEAFREEAAPDDPPNARALVEGHVARRTLFVWDDDGPVSMAATTRPTPHGISVNLVYTPPALRGRGYASACVAALSQAQLDAGRAFCTLFADVTNPVSNRIYQRTGYRPIGDFSVLRFVSPTGS